MPKCRLYKPEGTFGLFRGRVRDTPTLYTDEMEFDVNAVTRGDSSQKLIPVASDEIDLVQLARALWKQKTLIITVTALAGLIGLVYALLAPRYYSVQSVLRPAAIKDLDELNHLGIYELSPKQALAQVGAALDSYENRLGFFRDKRSKPSTTRHSNCCSPTPRGPRGRRLLSACS